MDTKVVMNIQTVWKGRAVFPGDSVKVDEKTAKRWINRGLAHHDEKNVGEPATIKVKKLKKNTTAMKK